MKNITLFILILANFTNVFAEEKVGEKKDQCAECKGRKAEMCHEECALVKDKKSECIEHCIKEYCSHKCLELRDNFSSDPVHLD